MLLSGPRDPDVGRLRPALDAAARRDEAVAQRAVISSILKLLAGIAKAVSAAHLLKPSGHVSSLDSALTMLARSCAERSARLPGSRCDAHYTFN